MSSDAAVQHDIEGRMFYIDDPAGRAYLAYLDLGKQAIDIYRTFVPDELRGRQLAAQLTAQALSYAAEQGYKVIPSCSYVARYMERRDSQA